MRRISIPSEWIRPIRQLVALYNEYGSIPRAIGAIISLYIVDSFLNLGAYLVNSVLLVFDGLTRAIESARLIVRLDAFWVGGSLLQAIRETQASVATAIGSLGPLGPVVVVAIASVTLVLLYRLLVALAGEIPGGSTLVDFLGLR